MPFPKYAILGNIGRVHVIHYVGDNKFWVVDKHDNRRLVHRDELKFIKGK